MDVIYIVERRKKLDRRAVPLFKNYSNHSNDRRSKQNRRGAAILQKVIAVGSYDDLISELEQVPHLDRYDIFASLDEQGYIYKVAVRLSLNVRRSGCFEERYCSW